MLTKHDLIQIKKLIDTSIAASEKRQDEKWEKRMNQVLDQKFNDFFNRLIPIFNTFVTKDEFYELKQDVAQLKEDVSILKDSFVRLDRKLDLYITFNDARVTRIEQHLGLSF